MAKTVDQSYQRKREHILHKRWTKMLKEMEKHLPALWIMRKELQPFVGCVEDDPYNKKRFDVELDYMYYHYFVDDHEAISECYIPELPCPI